MRLSLTCKDNFRFILWTYRCSLKKHRRFLTAWLPDQLCLLCLFTPWLKTTAITQMQRTETARINVWLLEIEHFAFPLACSLPYLICWEQKGKINNVFQELCQFRGQTAIVDSVTESSEFQSLSTYLLDIYCVPGAHTKQSAERHTMVPVLMELKSSEGDTGLEKKNTTYIIINYNKCPKGKVKRGGCNLDGGIFREMFFDLGLPSYQQGVPVIYNCMTNHPTPSGREDHFVLKNSSRQDFKQDMVATAYFCSTFRVLAGKMRLSGSDSNSQGLDSSLGILTHMAGAVLSWTLASKTYAHVLVSLPVNRMSSGEWVFVDVIKSGILRWDHSGLSGLFIKPITVSS